MTTFAILATGPSMSQAVADSVRGRCGVIAVSNAYALAPWADAVVSQDCAWWTVHRHATFHEGRKFCGPRCRMRNVETIECDGLIASGTNSGLLASYVAVKFFGATRILLLGLDMGGTHYFGRHPAPLTNASDSRFEVMCQQFSQWKPKGVEVVNCTPKSRLTCFPKKDLCDVLG